MIRLSRTLLSASAVILSLAACHPTMQSNATNRNNRPDPIPSQIARTTTALQQPQVQSDRDDKRNTTNSGVKRNEFTLNNNTSRLDPADAVSQRMVYRLDSLMQDPFLQKAQLGVYIYDLTKKCPIFELGKTQSMRPASTMKVITAITALSQLGTSYQFSTRLFTTGNVQKNKLHGSVYIKGGCDPLIGKTTVNEFVSALSKKGIRQITGDLVLDLSMKDDKEAGWGWCWDDHNPSLVPLLYQEKPEFGTAFQQALSRRGIRVNGHVKIGRVPHQATLVTVHNTSIDQVLKPMMKMSVNLAAESMFYQIAAQLGKPYVTHRTGAAYVKQFIQDELHLVPDNYRIADGSGLSLYNYITSELLVEALRYAYTNQDIYRHLLPSLPIAGEDGTLKNRMRYTPAHGNVCAKTGTVTGICSLAGYATAKNGHRLCFAIINQGQMRGAEARNFQDKICFIMTE